MSAESWRHLFPYAPHWHTLPDGRRLHYVDEGAGRPVVLLHGNPTWSFMYRDAIAALVANGFRAIAPDHLGCGLSDKPQDADYTLDAHVGRLESLLDALNLDVPLALVVHDWGGPIGLAFAERHPGRVRRIVLMNTIAWATRQFPKAIYLTKCPWLGALLVRRLNVLLNVALRRVPLTPLPPDVEAGYRAPYRSYRDRIAIQRFPQDIPLGPGHPSHEAFCLLERGLPGLRRHRVLALWGEHDFCFPLAFLDRWRDLLGDALEVRTFPNASHLLLEDQPEAVLKELLAFLRE